MHAHHRGAYKFAEVGSLCGGLALGGPAESGGVLISQEVTTQLKSMIL